MTTSLLVRPSRPAGTVRLSLAPSAQAALGTPAPTAPHRAAPRPALADASARPTSAPALELSADLPLPVLVSQALHAERDGRSVLWLTGRRAAAVASRLLRLTRTLAIGAELDLSQGAAGAALDAVALTQVGGARAHVLVRQARHLRALAHELGQSPRARATRFGGDAFAATLPAAGVQHVQVTAVVTHQGELVTALPLAHAVVVVAPTGVDAHVLVRRARAAVGWPDVAVHVAVPAGQRLAAWPHGDGVVLTTPAPQLAAAAPHRTRAA